MKTVIIGLAGHVDHGKSSLLQSLACSGVDRLPEEKKRGITITAGFTFMEYGEYIVYFVDLPGHESFVRNMIVGTRGVNAAIFAVDAKEGIMPQTREHAFILKSDGVNNIIVAITKIDTVSSYELEKTKAETLKFFQDYGFNYIKITETSIYIPNTIDKLREDIINSANHISEPSDNPFRMDIDRAFTVKGAGTVVTGSIISGEIFPNDEVYLYPLNKVVRIRKIQSANRFIEKAHGNMRVALNIADIKVDDVKKGSVLYKKDSIITGSRYHISLTLTPDCKTPPKDNKIYNIFMGTGKLQGRLLLKSGVMVLSADYPCVVGDIFYIRSGSPETTVASGIILGKYEKSEKVEQVKKEVGVSYTIPPYIEEVLSVVELFAKPISLADIIIKTGICEKDVVIAIKYLMNRQQVLWADKYYISDNLFKSYTEMVKGLIKEYGFADVISFRNKSGLSRNHATALLDKGDKLGLWREKGGKRY